MNTDQRQKRRMDIERTANSCRAKVAETFASFSDEELDDFAGIIALGKHAAYAPHFADVRRCLESLAFTAIMGELLRREEVRELEEG